MAKEWIDETSYAHGERGKVSPRTMSRKVHMFRLTVTRRHGLDGLYFDCEPFFSYRKMLEDTFEEALPAADRHFMAALTRALEEARPHES